MPAWLHHPVLGKILETLGVSSDRPGLWKLSYIMVAFHFVGVRVWGIGCPLPERITDHPSTASGMPAVSILWLEESPDQ